MTTTNGVLPHISDANTHFHDVTNWRVDRSNGFIKVFYTTEWDEETQYLPKELPKDIYDALFPDRRKEEREQEQEEYNALDECVDIPSIAYNLLPRFYTELLEFFPSKEEQDVFLCGMLPTVASALPNVQGAHADGSYSSDVFLALVASAGQGKGTAAKAFGLVEPIDNELRYESEQELLRYQAHEAALGKGEKMTEPLPAERCHIVPANASAIAMTQALYDNNGRAFIAETEIDSMLASDRNADWGNISSLLRSAFHHEAISVKRKSAYRGQTMLKIEHPSLSVFLSGTPAQFQELMHSTENGLFSRFAVYFHNPRIDWRTHRPTKQSMERITAIAAHGQTLKTLYTHLAKRKAEFPPVYVALSSEQWDAIDSAFSALQYEFYHEEQRPDLLPSARRGAIIAFRLAIQFAVLRYIDTDTALELFCIHTSSDENFTIDATDEDVLCAIHLARTFTYHAQALSSILPRTTKAVSSSKSSVMRFLEALPESFTTNEAVKIGEGISINQRRTIERYLKQLTESGALTKITNGKYCRIRQMS